MLSFRQMSTCDRLHMTKRHEAQYLQAYVEGGRKIIREGPPSNHWPKLVLTVYL